MVAEESRDDLGRGRAAEDVLLVEREEALERGHLARREVGVPEVDHEPVRVVGGVLVKGRVREAAPKTGSVDRRKTRERERENERDACAVWV